MTKALRNTSLHKDLLIQGDKSTGLLLKNISSLNQTDHFLTVQIIVSKYQDYYSFNKYFFLPINIIVIM
jgi:hypothetical protein